MCSREAFIPGMVVIFELIPKKNLLENLHPNLLLMKHQKPKKEEMKGTPKIACLQYIISFDFLVYILLKIPEIGKDIELLASYFCHMKTGLKKI